jgi:hypothetical protein
MSMNEIHGITVTQENGPLFLTFRHYEVRKITTWSKFADVQFQNVIADRVKTQRNTSQYRKYNHIKCTYIILKGQKEVKNLHRKTYERIV